MSRWGNAGHAGAAGEACCVAQPEGDPLASGYASLDEVLEPVEDVPKSAYLSPRMCAGILHRAAKFRQKWSSKSLLLLARGVAR